MNRYLLPLAATLVVSGIGLIACSPAGNCSPANCGGCCDSTGTCVTSTTASACGRLGEMCTSCSGATNVCSMGVCTAGTTGGGGGSMGGGAGGGTGGGTTGGGTGGGTTGGGTGGGAPACVAIDFSQAIAGPARYSEPAPGQMGTPNHQTYVFQPSSLDANRFDILAFESWYFGPNANPTFPQTTMVPGPAGASYADCAQCIVLDESCDNTGANCARSYYVQGGTLVINTATRNTVAGQLQFTATNLTMKEWTFMQTGDMEVPNGRCITIATVSYDGGWAPDGGMMTVDAGTDAGVVDAGTDAGLIDAGVDAGIEVDAGVDAGLDDAGIDAGP